MKSALPVVLFWLGTGLLAIVIWYFFMAVIGLPVGGWLVAALLATWLNPKPWRLLLVLSLAAEVAAITPPLAITAALWAPLLIWWLRGRVEVDLSFWYFILIAVSSALQIGLIVALATYPHWLEIPWLVVVEGWLAVIVVVCLTSLGLPSLYNRFLHDRPS